MPTTTSRILRTDRTAGPLSPVSPVSPVSSAAAAAPDLVTHAELLAIAARHLAAAHADLRATNPRPPAPVAGPHGRLQARADLLAYRELLHAVRLHAQRLFGPAARQDAVRRSLQPDPDDAAAVHLIDTLRAAVRRRPCPLGGHAAADATPAAHLLAAARAVRAATDLVATHQHRDGSWRAPDSHLLDHPAVRRHGLARIAALGAAVAALEPPLRFRARTMGLRWNEVSRPLPDLTAVRAIAADVLTRTGPEATGEHFLSRWLDALTVARPTTCPTTRSTDPLLAWQLQVDRLRAIGWEQVHTPHASVATLADLARAAHTWHRTHPTGDRHARCWEEVHRQLHRLATLEPADPAARHTGQAFVRLVRQATEPPLQQDHLLLGAAATFSEIAHFGAATITRLQTSGQLWIATTEMTGAAVSDQPALASAKLRRASVPAQTQHLRPVLQAYHRAARAAPLHAPGAIVLTTPSTFSP